MSAPRTGNVRPGYLIDAAERAGLSKAAGTEVWSVPDEGLAAAWAAVAQHYNITPDELARHVASMFKLEVADLAHVATHAIKLVPDRLVRRYHVCPVREEDRRLVVATSDPTAIDAEQAIGFVSGRTAEFVVAPPDALEEAISAHYTPEQAVENVIGRLRPRAGDGVRLLEDPEVQTVGADEAESAPVVKLTNLILRDAIAQRASDVHVEPGRNGGAVRFRVDGVLRHYMQLPMAALHRVVSRIKIVGKLDIADRIRPQDGRSGILVDGRTYDLRISTVPTREGEKAVVRMLDSGGIVGLDDLGVTAPELARFRSLLHFRDGLVIVTGPTGSGKTTTMYAGIVELSTGEQNIMTVEDPVEYELESINQIQVEPRQGVTFGSALRAILRQDPDVIFIGEIRDAETAQIAIQACMTGHLVLATLHTNDAVGVIPRLVDLGVDRASIAATLRGVIAQRLVRLVCECAVPAEEPMAPEEAHAAAALGVAAVARMQGCPLCGGSGYHGRNPVAEVVVSTPELESLIGKDASHMQLLSGARATGMRSMRESAGDLIRMMRTTPAEVERVLGEATSEPDEPDAGGPEKHTGGILVVEDDPVTRKQAKRLLEREGFAVTEAVDGRHAMDRLAQRADFELVITDLHMPRTDGRALLAHIRSTLATAGLPVVVLTSSTDPNMEIRLMEGGADDYIRKPIDPRRFLARIRGALRRAGVA